ncbi:putative BRCA1-associated, BRCT domain superfamily [Helianthus debilis subsp. tardiflorus]
METNGKMIPGKPLYVALAQRKEVRRARLQFMMVDFARTNGALVSKYWKDNVTHEIAATDANVAFTRTLKVLIAILNGKWVVTMECTAFNLSGRSYDFTRLMACVDAGRVVNEEPYEVRLDTHGCSGGPTAGRLRALSNE